MQPSEEQESVLVGVTCRKSDSPPDKRGFKESPTALVVVPSWGGNAKVARVLAVLLKAVLCWDHFAVGKYR